MPATQKFRARLRRDKYNPEDDPEFLQDEFGQYFSNAEEEEPGEYCVTLYFIGTFLLIIEII